MSTEAHLQEVTKQLKANAEAINQLALKVQELVLTRKHDYKLNEILGGKVEDLETVVFGRTERNITGLTTKLDRVETIEESRRWNLRAIWAVVLGIMASILKDMLGIGKEL